GPEVERADLVERKEAEESGEESREEPPAKFGPRTDLRRRGRALHRPPTFVPGPGRRTHHRRFTPRRDSPTGRPNGESPPRSVLRQPHLVSLPICDFSAYGRKRSGCASFSGR